MNEAVLKCLWKLDWRVRLAASGRIVDYLRRRGAPVPRHLAEGYDEALGTWYLQERLHGERLEQLTSSFLEQVLELHDLFRDAPTPLRSGSFQWNDAMTTSDGA